MQHSLIPLEYPLVIQLIDKMVQTPYGREEVSRITPLTDRTVIGRLLNETDEMRIFLEREGGLQFDSVPDCRDTLSAAGKDGFVLDTDELKAVVHSLLIYIENTDILAPSLSEFKALDNMLSNRGRAPYSFVKSVLRILDSDGNIADHASPELARIRRRKGQIRNDIQNRLNTVMDSDNGREALQERIITVREGRFVIPLRVQHRARIDSIVHAYSKSGETVFVEPREVFELNNEMVEIDGQELAEIRRILKGFTEQLVLITEDAQQILGELGRLEVCTAKARLCRKWKAAVPIIDSSSPPVLVLNNALHPLLGENCVPISISVGTDCQGLVISGPNAGGKTVALKTAGLLTLLALSGIPVPAGKESRIGIFRNVLAEIGDEQSLAENLSSFSGHILSLSNILEHTGPDSLVLIDEILSSTSPSEGEALARAYLEAILEKQGRFILTTHFGGVKEIAYKDGRVKNAFVAFDEENMKPLYRLVSGGTGSSYALNTARKYGLPAELLNKALKYLEERATEAEKAMKNIEETRNELARRGRMLEDEEKKVRLARSETESALMEVRRKEEILREKGLSALESELDHALKEISRLKNELKKKKELEKEVLLCAEEKIRSAAQIMTREKDDQLRKKRVNVSHVLPGSRVFVQEYSNEGLVESVRDGKARVKVGIFTVTVPVSSLFEPDSKNQDNGDKNIRRGSFISDAAPFQIDMRGMRADEAMKLLEKTVDDCIMGGSSILHIIHGKGEGILRKAVWDYLKDIKDIKEVGFARPEDGGQGKTIVQFR